MSSDSGDDFSVASGSDFSADCVDEYSVDSDGNIKPGQDVKQLPKSMAVSGTTKSSGDQPELSLDERRKKKRLEKLDKRIKNIQKKHDKEKKIQVEPKLIKNKQKRQEVALMKKMENRRVSKIEKLKKEKIREEHGEEAAPKGVTKTIESMRVKDETIITDADDEEIKGEHSIDEFASYFKNETTPRILLTTNRRPNGVSCPHLI